MSNQFYSYLSDRVISYFRNNPLEAGSKFYIQFETEEYVKCLYDELRSSTISRDFVYSDEARSQRYETYELDFGRIQLLVASTADGLHPDFLATLRNMVGIEAGYEHKAILFIHSSSLDSILGGAGSLHKEGMPFHVGEIEKDIRHKLSDASFSLVDKAIIEMYLQSKKDELTGANPSVFEYEHILEVVSGVQIKGEEYAYFGIFPDDSLQALPNENKIKQRLIENHDNFVRIAEIHDYGISDDILEKKYGGKGADRLKKDDWKKTQFADIENFLADAKNKTVIEYIPNMDESKYWDKEEGTSKANFRKRNIIVFNEDNKEQVELDFSFSDFTKKEGIIIPDMFFKNSLECVSSGKKLHVTLKNIELCATFYEIKYEVEGVKFDFRIMVAMCDRPSLYFAKTAYSVIIEKKKDDCALYINSDDSSIVINEYAEDERQINISEDKQLINVGKERIILTIDEDYPYKDDNENVRFLLKMSDCIIPVVKEGASEKPTVIEGIKVWKLKRDHKSDFIYVGENKLRHGTKLYFTRDEFRKNLELEKIFLEKSALGLIENEMGQYTPMQIEVTDDVKCAFNEVINYFRKRNTLPSLTYVSDELESLYKIFIKRIIDFLDALNEDTYLTTVQKDLFYLGTIKRNVEDKEILLTPLHPINIAYQLHIRDVKTDCIGDNEFDMMRKFQQLYLLPYININPSSGEPKVYIPAEQNHSPEWKIYVDESLPRYKGSKDYVSKLVAEKIQEFTEHFNYLFDMGKRAPIKINLINTGDSKEILQGIFKYYVRQLSKQKQILPMYITVYTDKKITNAFEEFAGTDDILAIKERFHLDLKVEDMNEDEIVDLYRDNVCFYSKSDEEELEYAHITFMEMKDKSQTIKANMNDIPSGVIMNGISSGTPSVLLGETYCTGFGSRYANDNSGVMDIVIKYNALNAAMDGSSYKKNTCCAQSIPKSNGKDLDQIYDKSNWVTFINPKVNLSYFKNDPSSKDLLIIHYSDQYNATSSGYDAITVTRRSRQYQNVIEDYLLQNGVIEAGQKSPQIINMFNAINGDWLLRLLSKKSYFPKEKLSILSAIKLAIKCFANDEIIWVPISLEEVLRVTGATGLRQRDSIFSAKNLGFENSGATSDDILLVGIRNESNVQVMFYPIEVKIGQNKPGYIEKGIEQALSTKQMFNDILELGICSDKNIRVRILRNFFMQLTVASAEKLLLYEVGDDQQRWREVTETDLRKKLLNEEYEIVSNFNPAMGKAGLISFKKGCSKESEYCCKEVFIIEKSEQEGVNILAKDLSQIEIIQWGSVQYRDEVEEDVQEESPDLVQSEAQDEPMYSQSDVVPSQEQDEMRSMDNNDNTLDSIRVLIGKDQLTQKVYWEFGNSQLANRHLLITGTSGQGKTYAIQTMLYELVQANISSVIFDYTEGFMPAQLEHEFSDSLGDRIKQHIIYNEGVPINPFKRHEVEIADKVILEKAADVATRLADIFSHVYGLGEQQSAAIFDAVLSGINTYGDAMNMRHFQQELEEVVKTNKAAKTVISKMSPFFHSIDFTEDKEFDWGKLLYSEDAAINIFQLTLISREMQVIITELMLWDAWYYTKKYGNKNRPFVVVLDEAQNLSHKSKSPSASILTEGRKFGWSAWFATQSLKILKDDEVVRLLQAAFKLYFKPTDDEIMKTAKQLDPTGEIDWISTLKELKKGQCIVVGDRQSQRGAFGATQPTITNVSSFKERC